MCKSIFSTTCLPRPNSISATHFTTKFGRQGCRRKAKTCRPNDCMDHNNLNHNNTFGNPLHNIQKVSKKLQTWLRRKPCGRISHPWQYTHRNYGLQVTPAHMTCISLNFVAADRCILTGRILFCAI